MYFESNSSDRRLRNESMKTRALAQLLVDTHRSIVISTHLGTVLLRASTYRYVETLCCLPGHGETEYCFRLGLLRGCRIQEIQVGRLAKNYSFPTFRTANCYAVQVSLPVRMPRASIFPRHINFAPCRSRCSNDWQMLKVGTLQS